MSIDTAKLKSVAQAAKQLRKDIVAIRDAGGDQKTDDIENRALALIDKLSGVVDASVTAGSTTTDDVSAVLNQQRLALKAYLNQPGITYGERLNTRVHLQDVMFKLAQLELGKTLTWSQLLTPSELAEFKKDLKDASREVRQRKRLDKITTSVMNIGLLAVDLATRIVTKGVVSVSTN